MGSFSEAHRLVDASSVDSLRPRILPLSRKIASELTVAAVLAPLAVSDLGAMFEDVVYSTDASDSHGAITSTGIPAHHVAIWRACRSKGAYSRLKTPFESLMIRLGLREEGDEVENEDEHSWIAC